MTNEEGRVDNIESKKYLSLNSAGSGSPVDMAVSNIRFSVISSCWHMNHSNQEMSAFYVNFFFNEKYFYDHLSYFDALFYCSTCFYVYVLRHSMLTSTILF